MSIGRIAAPCLLVLIGVVAWSLWPHGPPPTVYKDEQKRVMQEVLDERSKANLAGLLGGAAIPAIHDDGSPPPWAAVVPKASAEVR